MSARPRRKTAAPALPPTPPTARAALDAAMDEKTLRKAVTDLLTAHKWRWSYTPDSRMVQGHRGIPDIIAVRNGRLLFIELKTERGRVSAYQRAWIGDLVTAVAIDRAAEIYVWRPRDLSKIETILAQQQQGVA